MANAIMPQSNPYANAINVTLKGDGAYTEQDVSALVPVQESVWQGEQVQTVNARNLYAFLEIGRDFSNWIKGRIEKYGFVENQDFIVLAQTGENLQGGRPAIEYHVTLDMAKELSMVERNAKGKEARQYFIACERQLKSGSVPTIQDPILAAHIQALIEIDRIKHQNALLERQQAELEARQNHTERRLDQIETATDHFTIIGWHRYAKASGSLPIPEASAMGRKATKYCCDNNIQMGDVPDPRFGSANTYPKWVLDHLFGETVN